MWVDNNMKLYKIMQLKSYNKNNPIKLCSL